MSFNTTFAMTHFLKLYYNVFILENKIDARVFRRTCINLCHIIVKMTPLEDPTTLAIIFRGRFKNC